MDAWISCFQTRNPPGRLHKTLQNNMKKTCRNLLHLKLPASYDVGLPKASTIRLTGPVRSISLYISYPCKSSVKLSTLVASLGEILSKMTFCQKIGGIDEVLEKFYPALMLVNIYIYIIYI